MPAYADTLTTAAELRASRDFDAAAGLCREVLAVAPMCAEAHHVLGATLVDRGAEDAALAHLMKAAELAPDIPAYHNALGALHKARGEWAAAVSAYERVTRLAPDDAQARVDLSVALRLGGDLPAAVLACEEAVRLVPTNVTAHMQLSLALHLSGDFKRSWDEYGWRCRSERFESRALPEPLWDGSPLEGRRILLMGEQGLGDQLQFIRYAELVKERGGFVIVACHWALVRLFATCPGIDEVVELDTPMPPRDCWTFLGNLPGLLETTLETVPSRVPYLAADPRQAGAWRKLLRTSRAAVNVGINWEGNLQNVEGRGREIPLEHFLEVAAIPGVRLFSLQKGDGAQQLSRVPPGVSIPNLGRFFNDLADTAALVDQLDLVLTNDTSVAHLAGALGRPVWVVTPRLTCWRYLRDREDSPWYPSMRLFRRTWHEGWDAAFGRVAAAMARLVDERLARGDTC